MLLPFHTSVHIKTYMHAHAHELSWTYAHAHGFLCVCMHANERKRGKEEPDEPRDGRNISDRETGEEGDR